MPYPDDEDDRDVEELCQERKTISVRGKRLPDSAVGGLAAELGRGHARPHGQRDTPVVLDTDIGGDVGHGQRARFARLLLDQLGRPDVAVVAGRRLRVTRQSRLYALLGEEATGWGGLLRDHLVWFDWLSTSAEYELCNRWLEKVLISTTEPTFRGDPPPSGIGEKWT